MRAGRRFLLILGFELSLAVLAFAAGRVSAVSPRDGLRSSAQGIGAAFLLALLGFFFFQRAYESPRPSMRSIRIFLDEVARPLFLGVGPFGLCLLAGAAGLGEEALFRGWLQPWAEAHFGTIAGCGIAALAFGFAHPMSSTYIVYAALIGFALGMLRVYSGGWIAPALSHALYDFLALVWFIRKKI